MLPIFTQFAAACTQSSPGFLDFPTWYKYLPNETVAGKCSPIIDISDASSIGKIILAVVEILLRIGGLVAVGFVIYGGIQYILSQGDPQKAVSARHAVINALVGMVIAAMSTFIVQLIGKSLIK